MTIVYMFWWELRTYLLWIMYILSAMLSTHLRVIPFPAIKPAFHPSDDPSTVHTAPHWPSYSRHPSQRHTRHMSRQKMNAEHSEQQSLGPGVWSSTSTRNVGSGAGRIEGRLGPQLTISQLVSEYQGHNCKRTFFFWCASPIKTHITLWNVNGTGYKVNFVLRIL